HQHAVEALAAAHRLDAVGDHLAGHEAALHALRAHGDAVGDGYGAEHLGHAAGSPHGLVGNLGQGAEAGVAWRDGAVAVGDADYRFVEVVVSEADRSEHGAVRCTGVAGGGHGATTIEFVAVNDSCVRQDAPPGCCLDSNP